MIALCNPVAIQAFMDISFKASTNDDGIGQNNPAVVNSVESTTGQNEETDGAYLWNSVTDYLQWPASVGNSLATKINQASTMVGFFKFDVISPINDFFRILGQYESSGSVGFLYGFNTFSGLVDVGQFFVNSGPKTTISNYHDTDWHLWGFRTKDNSTNLNIDFFRDNVFDSGTVNYAGTTSTHTLRLGGRASSGSEYSFKGKAHTFRFYESFLQDGEIAMIVNQQGRII